MNMLMKSLACLSLRGKKEQTVSVRVAVREKWCYPDMNNKYDDMVTCLLSRQYSIIYLILTSFTLLTSI